MTIFSLLLFVMDEKEKTWYGLIERSDIALDLRYNLGVLPPLENDDRLSTCMLRGRLLVQNDHQTLNTFHDFYDNHKTDFSKMSSNLFIFSKSAYCQKAPMVIPETTWKYSLSVGP